MKHVLAVALLGVGLAAVGGAQAKAPLDGIDLCGSSGCAHIAWPEAEQLVIGWSQEMARPAAFTPFYALHLRWPEKDQVAYWAPDARALRDVTGTWSSVTPTARAILSRAAASVEPFEVQPTRVTVGGRAVRAPATYVRLLRGGKPVSTWQATPWLSVRMETAVPTPWSDPDAQLLLARRAPLVTVDSWVFRIPKSVARRALRGLPLR